MALALHGPSPGELSPAVPGRARELSLAVARYDAFGRGAPGGLLVLRGPAEVGLLEVLRGVGAQLRLRGAPVLGDGHSRPELAYAPFAAVVRGAQAFLAERHASAERRLAALACAEGCHAFWFDHAEGAESGPGPGEGIDRFRLDAPSRERRLAFLEAVVGLVEDVARVRPPVILLGDLTALDPGSAELVEHLAAGLGPLGRALPWLGVATLADGAPDAVSPRLGAGAEVVRVEPFDLDGLREYLAHPAVLTRLHSRTGGLPDRLRAVLEGTDPAGDAPVPPPPGGPRPTDPLLAALEAGAWDDAAQLATSRADALEARLAQREASEVLRTAAARIPPDRAIALRVRAAELAWALGARDEALAHARAARAGAPDDAWAALREAHLLRFGAPSAEVVAALDEAQRRAAAARDVVAELEVDAQRAELAYRDGATVEAGRLARAVLERAISEGASRVELDARNTLGKVALAQSRLDAAAAHFATNAERAAAADLPRRACQARNNLAIVALHRDDLDGAARHLGEAVALASAHGAVYHRAVAVENLAVLLHLRGDYAKALERYQEAVQLLKLLGDRDMLARAAFNLGELYADLGDLHRALGLVRFGEGVAGERPSPAVAAEGCLSRARAELALGRLDEARLGFGAALERVGEGPIGFRARLGLARAALAAGDAAAAERALPLIDDAPAARARAHLALVAAEIAARAGATTAAERARAAVEAAERAADDPACLEALRLRARARLDAGETEGAAADLARARTLEQRLAACVPAAFRATFDRRPARRELDALDVAASGLRPAGPEPRARQAEAALDELFYRKVRDGAVSIYDVRKSLERHVVERALAETGGNITRAARLLGMKRPRLSQLLKEYGDRGGEMST